MLRRHAASWCFRRERRREHERTKKDYCDSLLAAAHAIRTADDKLLASCIHAERIAGRHAIRDRHDHDGHGACALRRFAQQEATASQREDVKSVSKARRSVSADEVEKESTKSHPISLQSTSSSVLAVLLGLR